MLAYLLASLPFLAGTFSPFLTSWPAEMPWLGGFVPRPLVSAALALIILLIVLNRWSRQLLGRLIGTAALNSRLYADLNGHPSPGSQLALAIALAGFGWGVFTSMRSLDLWTGLSRSQGLVSPECVPPMVYGFIAGGLVVLGGWPACSLGMARTARYLAESGASVAGGSYDLFARNLVYPFSLLPLLAGMSQASGVKGTIALALGWFLLATVVAAREVLSEDREMAVAVALMGALLPSLAFLLVPGTLILQAVGSAWQPPEEAYTSLLDVESFWLLGAFTLGTTLALSAGSTALWSRWRYARLRLSWQRAADRWRRLLYCERCDGVHLPNQKDFVPASEGERLLLGGQPGDGSGRRD